MAESPMIGARVPVEWQRKIQGIAEASGRKEAEIVREAICASQQRFAIARYLGETDSGSIKGILDDHEDRIAALERKLGRLAG